MPELPEVETVVRDLRAAGLPGCVIRAVRLMRPHVAEGIGAGRLSRRLRGRRIDAIARRGKYVVLRLEPAARLLIHLRMTGSLRLASAGELPGRHDHAVLTLDDGRALCFCDPRKFGRWRLEEGTQSKLDTLGVEPLSARLTGRRFDALLARRRGMLKPLLLNQRVLSGMGNIYVDEALWDAGLHPRLRAEDLTPAQRRRLYRSIRVVLRRGIRALGTTLGGGITGFASGGRPGRNQHGLRVFRRTGQPCPRCGDPIRRLVVGQRSTHVCPACQPPPASDSQFELAEALAARSESSPYLVLGQCAGRASSPSEP
jgi:formamidopyrimidine-DNA glycosylase